MVREFNNRSHDNNQLVVESQTRPRVNRYHGSENGNHLNTTSKHTEQTRTNKTIENQRADVKLRQDIDDFDNFNNSDDDEKIEMIEDDFEIL